MWNIAKLIPKGKFVPLNAYAENEEDFKINDLSFYLEKVENKIKHITV
jgi:hypothetical protein